MANKQQANASSHAKRRQQERVSRHGQINKENRTRNRRRSAPVKRGPWILVGSALAVIAIIIGVFLFISNQSSPAISTTSPSGTLADATTLKQVTGVDTGLLDQIGTSGVANPFKAAKSSSAVLTGPTGKPEVFFYGAEWCPLCAAERWSVVVALSRFGTFQRLGETASASDDSYPSTSTFTFYQSTYTSSAIDFVPLENQDSQHNALQSPNADEQQLLTRYKVSGYPFMDIGERYLITSASYDPSVLRTNPQDPTSQPLTQQAIAAQLSTENTLSKSVLGIANYLTAAICTATKNQPSQTCSDTSIQHIEAALSQTPQFSVLSPTSPLKTIASVPVLDIWRRQATF